MLPQIDELEASLELLTEELLKAGITNPDTYEVISEAFSSLYFIENELLETYGVEEAALQFHKFLSDYVPDHVSIAADEAAAPLLLFHLQNLHTELEARHNV